MIKKFIDKFMDNKDKLEKIFSKKHPDYYDDIVKAVIEILTDIYEWDNPDPNRIHKIDDGDYQGTLVYVIGASGYQPNDYWYVFVDYGSCSGCDTLEYISSLGDYGDDKPTQQQVKEYMDLALHIVQSLKKMKEDEQ